MKGECMDKVREALAELVAATDPRGDTPVEGWKSAWRKAREALSAQPAEPVALIAAAVDRVRNTIILECETHEMLRENIARRVADVGKPTFAQPAPSEPAAWRCFHCDEVFTELEAAELHFGKSEMDRPFCQIDVAHFRWMEAQHRRNVDDDSEALRTVGSLVGEHERLRRQAEELGYARGLADAQKHPEDLGLAAAPHPAAKGGEQ